ncbi:ras GEF [Daedalea quercina L-15889]|uniref:Ras GEF n=1 Tax=Daedalea quercina L-15889 TaxID=1314783 RepID=A0A165TRM9_9APHY|nr:ras GEF [Daedalea quercina L-15889]
MATVTAAASGPQLLASSSTGYDVQQDAQQFGSQGVDQEDEMSTFWCRALYDYQPPDGSSLSFRKDDIIEVLSRLDTGWWDGLLGEQRGWFPSNYVTVISEEEAEMALGGGGMFTTQVPSIADSFTVDMTSSGSGWRRSDDDEWGPGEMEFLNQASPGTHDRNGLKGEMVQHNDFWVPQVSQDGRIFYVNTQTGQQSRDIPREPDSDPDADLAALSSQLPSGAGPNAGFGTSIPNRSPTPEPWIRRLTDDGLSYHYVNKLSGEESWTLPPSALAGRLRSESSVSASTGRPDSFPDWLSMASPASSVFPAQRDRRGSTPGNHAGANSTQQAGQIALTPPEHLARTLQQALAAPQPKSPIVLSDQVQKAIAAVLRYLQTITSRQPEQLEELDRRVLEVVSAIRNLVYVTASPPNHIPASLYPRDAEDPRPSSAASSSQTHLKVAQRKVAGALSKFVLSALAMQYDPGLQDGDRQPGRLESDIAELERAVAAFVMDVRDLTGQEAPEKPLPTKRLYGAFSTANVGLGLPGAGVGGTWRGFGYVPLDVTAQPPMQILSTDRVSDMKAAMKSFLQALSTAVAFLKRADLSIEHVRTETKNALTQLDLTLKLVNSIDIARHVDVDGIGAVVVGQNLPSGQYTQIVDSARLLMRTLEASLQSLYDDGSSLLIAIQRLGQPWTENRAAIRDHIDALLDAVIANADVMVQSLESLLVVGHDEANTSQFDYRSSIDWRLSRPPDLLDLDATLDLGTVLSRKPPRPLPDPKLASINTVKRIRADSVSDAPTPASSSHEVVSASEETLVSPSIDPTGMEKLATVSQLSKSPPRSKAGASKAERILGSDLPSHIKEKLDLDSKPWYLRPNYDQSEIMLEPDGTVRAGTPAALVERLTAHEQVDTTFNHHFLLTFKSFMTVDQLFNLLVRRFYIEAPPNLSPIEFEDWSNSKQCIIRFRVLNILKTMVTDEGVLEKSDMYILGPMKEFVSNEDVVNIAAAKQLLILIERSQKGGEMPVKITTVPIAPPAPYLPRNPRNMKLLDIDPIEIARQLTLMEFAMYKKIRSMECLMRSKASKPGKHNDSFSQIIQLTNKIGYWVAESILENKDSKRRASIVKHFVMAADQCRILQNYSTMNAIVSGLAGTSVRRLKRTWEQVDARTMERLRLCESNFETIKNYNSYRHMLAGLAPPCLPFIGSFLTTLVFINDGSGDKLGDDMINFRKRQKAAEVIQDIKRWQSNPYNFATVASILSYLEQCLNKYADDGVDYADQLWKLSLEREPKEREDERMARLLQESGFL